MTLLRHVAMTPESIGDSRQAEQNQIARDRDHCMYLEHNR
jgi:hypothetical protein